MEVLYMAYASVWFRTKNPWSWDNELIWIQQWYTGMLLTCWKYRGIGKGSQSGSKKFLAKSATKPVYLEFAEISESSEVGSLKWLQLQRGLCSSFSSGLQ